MTRIAANLEALRVRVERAARESGREPDAVRIVAIAKTFPAAAVEEAIAAGQLLLGENRVQEAKAKYPPLRARHPGLVLHLVGSLQTNKAEEAVRLFDLIETVDRERLAAALAAAMDKAGRRIPVYLEVNTGREPQKAGVLPEEAPALLDLCRERGLEVRGLMSIPPADADPAPHFSLLADLARRLGLPELSMGMSADFELAIRMGATHVRIGTAIFGPRR